MNLSAIVYKPNRQHIPAFPAQPIAVRVAQADAKAHPRLSGITHRGTRGASRRQSNIRLSGITGPNGSGPSANRFISKRARARSAGARLKPARPKTPPAKHHPNQPAPNRRRQNAAHTHKTAPRIRRPKHPRQKAPKIKWGPDQTRTPLALFRAMPLNCGFYSQPRQCFRGNGLCSPSTFSINLEIVSRRSRPLLAVEKSVFAAQAREIAGLARDHSVTAFFRAEPAVSLTP